MKSLLPLLLLGACMSSRPPAPRPEPLATPAGAALRHPEVLQAYHLGRYVDPHVPALMHQEHEVYRVEQSGHWDLRPGLAGGRGIGSPPPDATLVPAPVDDALRAEVNAQRLATAQILAQSRTLAAAVTQFQTAWQQTQTNLLETAALRARLIGMQERLNALSLAGAVSPGPASGTAPAAAPPTCP